MNDPVRTILDYLDQAATDEQVIELERWLGAAPGNVTRFLLLSAFHSGLRDQLVSREAIAADESEEVEVAPGPAEIGEAATPIHRGSAVWCVAYGVAAALLVAGAIATVYGLVARPQDPASGPLSRDAIATLIDASSTVFVNGEFADPGSEFSAGTYAIESGEAEILLRSRVSMNLRQATRVVLRSPMYAVIEHGDARFDVPKDARGFTVELPDGSRIVDLGTTFRVEVGGAGYAALQVLQGEVEWIGTGPTNESVLIRAGQSARFEGGRLVPMTTRLALDFQGSSGVTASGFESFDDRRASGSGTASATYDDVTVTLTGLDRRNRAFFSRDGVASSGTLTLSDAYRDFVYDNTDGQMTLVLSGPGIRPHGVYMLTFYAYDAGNGTQPSGAGESQSVSFTGAAGTVGHAGPITYTVGVDPERDDQYAAMGLFTADSAGTLTIEIAEASAEPRHRVRLSAIVLAIDTEVKRDPAAGHGEADVTWRANTP